MNRVRESARRTRRINNSVVRDHPRDGSSTQDRILDALLKHLSARNTLEVTLVDVANEAGVNHALVGYYFGNKEGMFLALLRRGTQGAAHLLQKLLASDRTPPEKLRFHLRGMVESYAHTPVIGVITDTLLSSGSPDAVEEISTTLIRPLTDFYAAIVKEGVEKGVFRDIDPMFLHMQIVGCCNFLFFANSRLVIGYGVSHITAEILDRYVAYLTDGVLRSIGAD